MTSHVTVRKTGVAAPRRLPIEVGALAVARSDPMPPIARLPLLRSGVVSMVRVRGSSSGRRRKVPYLHSWQRRQVCFSSQCSSVPLCPLSRAPCSSSLSASASSTIRDTGAPAPQQGDARISYSALAFSALFRPELTAIERPRPREQHKERTREESTERDRTRASPTKSTLVQHNRQPGSRASTAATPHRLTLLSALTSSRDCGLRTLAWNSDSFSIVRAARRPKLR